MARVPNGTKWYTAATFYGEDDVLCVAIFKQRNVAVKETMAIYSKNPPGGGAEELEQDVEGLIHGTSSVA